MRSFLEGEIAGALVLVNGVLLCTWWLLVLKIKKMGTDGV